MNCKKYALFLKSDPPAVCGLTSSSTALFQDEFGFLLTLEYKF